MIGGIIKINRFQPTIRAIHAILQTQPQQAITYPGKAIRKAAVQHLHERQKEWFIRS